MWSSERTGSGVSTRRGVLVAAAAALGMALGSCGFQLRRPPELQLRRVQLSGFGRYSGQADELRRQLRASPGVELAEVPEQAEVVLEALLDSEERVATSSTAAGQVRDLSLRTRLRFRVRTPGGRELIAPTELALSRDMTYLESNALAKEHEAQIMFRAMQADIANQVLRRLAALSPALAAAPASAPASVPASAASAP